MVGEVETGVAGGEREFLSRAPRKNQRCPAPWFPTSEGRNPLYLYCGAVCGGLLRQRREADAGVPGSLGQLRRVSAVPLSMLTGPALVPGFP